MKIKAFLFLLLFFGIMSEGLAQDPKFYLNSASAEKITYNGEKYIHIKSNFRLRGLKNRTVKFCAYLYQDIFENDYSEENARILMDRVFTREISVPSNNETFDDFQMYVPWEQIVLLPGHHKYYVGICISTGYGNRIDPEKVLMPTISLYGPGIQIERLNLAQNIIDADGYPCLRIDYKVTCTGLEGRDVDIYACLVDENSQLVPSGNYWGYSVNNYTAVKKSIVLPYESTSTSGSFIFPNFVISPYEGEHKYCIQLIVCDKEEYSEIRDIKVSPWFYIARGKSYTSNYPKPKSSGGYASSRSSSSSQSSSESVLGKAIGIAAIGALVVGAYKAITDNGSSSSSKSTSSYSSPSSSSSYRSSGSSGSGTKTDFFDQRNIPSHWTKARACVDGDHDDTTVSKGDASHCFKCGMPFQGTWGDRGVFDGYWCTLHNKWIPRGDYCKKCADEGRVKPYK